MIDFERQRQFADRIAQHQRLLQLPLFIGTRELREQYVSVVALAELQLGLERLVVQLGFDVPVLAVLRAIRTVVAQDVIAVDVLLRPPDSQAEVVVIEQRLPAGIGCQGHEHLLSAVAQIGSSAL